MTTMAAAAPVFAEAPLVVSVHQIFDVRAKFDPEFMRQFTTGIWPEAVRDFGRCGIQLQGAPAKGEMGRAPSGRPVFKGLAHGVINFVVTDNIPMEWDTARGLAALTTQYDGYHLCLVALPRAHGHQIPFVSTNTCVHELLHVLMQDIFEVRPKGAPGAQREFRIDWYATRLWLFHEGEAVRSSARAYLERVRLGPGGMTLTRLRGYA